MSASDRPLSARGCPSGRNISRGGWPVRSHRASRATPMTVTASGGSRGLFGSTNCWPSALPSPKARRASDSLITTMSGEAAAGASAFVVCEDAALQHAQAQDVEVLRADAVHERADGAAGTGWILDVHVGVRAERGGAERRRCEPWCGDDAIEHVAVVRALRIQRVALSAGIELVHRNVIRIEAQVVRHHALQRDDEHERTRDERHRQRQLGGGQDAAETLAAHGETSAGLQKGRRSSAACRRDRGNHSGGDAARDSDTESRRQDVHVQRHVKVRPCRHRRHQQRRDELFEPQRQRHAKRRAGDRQDEAFGQLHRHQAPSIGAERQPHRALALSARRPHHHQVRDVGTAEKQQDRANWH